MTALMLSAGKATRLNGACKAAAVIGRRPMHEWWHRVLLERITVVCRSEHADALPTQTIVCDDGGGPAVALATALESPLVDSDRPLTVIFGDTWVPACPLADEFCGVAAAGGGRSWDVIEDGLLAYRHVDDGEAALVAIGLYRFARPDDLRTVLDKVIADAHPTAEVGMADVVNAYGLPFVPVTGWQDVGDFDARRRWRLM